MAQRYDPGFSNEFANDYGFPTSGEMGQRAGGGGLPPQRQQMPFENQQQRAPTNQSVPYHQPILQGTPAAQGSQFRVQPKEISSGVASFLRANSMEQGAIGVDSRLQNLEKQMGSAQMPIGGRSDAAARPIAQMRAAREVPGGEGSMFPLGAQVTPGFTWSESAPQAFDPRTGMGRAGVAPAAMPGMELGAIASAMPQAQRQQIAAAHQMDRGLAPRVAPVAPIQPGLTPFGQDAAMFGGMFPQGAAVPPIQDRLAFQREGEREAPPPAPPDEFIPPPPAAPPIEEGAAPSADGEGQVDPVTQQPLKKAVPLTMPEGEGQFEAEAAPVPLLTSGDDGQFEVNPSAIDQLTALNDEIAKLFGPGGVISKGIINQYKKQVQKQSDQLYSQLSEAGGALMAGGSPLLLQQSMDAVNLMTEAQYKVGLAELQGKQIQAGILSNVMRENGMNERADELNELSKYKFDKNHNAMVLDQAMKMAAMWNLKPTPETIEMFTNSILTGEPLTAEQVKKLSKIKGSGEKEGYYVPDTDDKADWSTEDKEAWKEHEKNIEKWAKLWNIQDEENMPSFLGFLGGAVISGKYDKVNDIIDGTLSVLDSMDADQLEWLESVLDDEEMWPEGAPGFEKFKSWFLKKATAEQKKKFNEYFPDSEED